MQLRFWASPSDRIWFSVTQREKKRHTNLQFNPLFPSLIYGLEGCSKLVPMPWPQPATVLLLVSLHPSAGAEAEDDTPSWGVPLLCSCVSSHTHLWTPPPPRLHCVLHHFIYFSSGLSFILIFSSWNDQLLSRLNDPFSHQRDQKKIKVGFGEILRNKPWFYPQIFAIRFRSLVDKSLK